jgi:hypothetical protein
MMLLLALCAGAAVESTDRCVAALSPPSRCAMPRIGYLQCPLDTADLIRGGERRDGRSALAVRRARRSFLSRSSGRSRRSGAAEHPGFHRLRLRQGLSKVTSRTRASLWGCFHCFLTPSKVIG